MLPAGSDSPERLQAEACGASHTYRRFRWPRIPSFSPVGVMSMVSISAFQADGAGSNPVTHTTRPLIGLQTCARYAR